MGQSISSTFASCWELRAEASGCCSRSSCARAGIQYGEMERRRTSSLPPSQVPALDDCLSRCLCYTRLCGPFFGPPMFDGCMSPVDLRLRQLKGQEKRLGSGAVYASRSFINNSYRYTNYNDDSVWMASPSSSMNGDGIASIVKNENYTSMGEGSVGLTEDMFIVYMPSRQANTFNMKSAKRELKVNCTDEFNCDIESVTSDADSDEVYDEVYEGVAENTEFDSEELDRLRLGRNFVREDDAFDVDEDQRNLDALCLDVYKFKNQLNNDEILNKSTSTSSSASPSPSPSLISQSSSSSNLETFASFHPQALRSGQRKGARHQRNPSLDASVLSF